MRARVGGCCYGSAGNLIESREELIALDYAEFVLFLVRLTSAGECFYEEAGDGNNPRLICILR